jgi:hypothetical protein
VWSEVHCLSLRDYQWQAAKEEAVTAADFPAAAKCRDAQAELRRRIDVLAEKLPKD